MMSTSCPATVNCPSITAPIHGEFSSVSGPRIIAARVSQSAIPAIVRQSQVAPGKRPIISGPSGRNTKPKLLAAQDLPPLREAFPVQLQLVSLAEKLGQQKTINLADLARIGRILFTVLKHFHQFITFLNPGTLFVDDQWRLFIVDGVNVFSIIKRGRPISYPCPLPAPELFQCFSAPDTPSVSASLTWSAGATLFYLFTGKSLFPETTLDQHKINVTRTLNIEIEDFENGGSVATSKLVQELRSYAQTHQIPEGPTLDEFIDFLHLLLTPRVENRLTIDEALSHPFLQKRPEKH